MHGEHGLGRLDRAEAAPRRHLGAGRLRREGDHLAGEMQAEAGGANDDLAALAPHPHVVLGVVEEVGGDAALVGFSRHVLPTLR